MITRLSIDIDTGQSTHTMEALYRNLVREIEKHGYKVMDTSPCTEDITEHLTREE